MTLSFLCSACLQNISCSSHHLPHGWFHALLPVWDVARTTWTMTTEDRVPGQLNLEKQFIVWSSFPLEYLGQLSLFRFPASPPQLLTLLSDKVFQRSLYFHMLGLLQGGFSLAGSFPTVSMKILVSIYWHESLYLLPLLCLHCCDFKRTHMPFHAKLCIFFHFIVLIGLLFSLPLSLPPSTHSFVSISKELWE